MTAALKQLRSRSFALVLTGSLVLAWAGNQAVSGAEAETTRASVATDGTQGNAQSFDPHVSADGRLVVFESDASNLVADDTNGARDIFVHDKVNQTTTRVSVSTAGIQGTSDSGGDPIISCNGRYVAFPSYASNLVPGDTNGKRDMFVHDLVAQTTTRVSLSTFGAQGDGSSFDPYVSGDGRFVTFSSAATNLVSGDTNGATDVFVRDTAEETTTRVSVPTGGSQANDGSEDAVMGDDGRYVAFSSLATNLVSGDTNGQRDTFVRDLLAGTTVRINVSPTGAQGNGSSGYNPAISADGRFVAFNDDSSNLVPGDTNGKRDVFVSELATGIVTRVSVSSSGAQENGSSTSAPSLSRDGRYVAFLSAATNLVPGDTNTDRDVFLGDRAAGTTTRVSVASDGTQSKGGDCFSQPYVNAAATMVVFTCGATNLVPGDTNAVYDVFLRTLPGAAPTPGDTTAPTVSIDAPSNGATVSGAAPVSATATDDTGVARVEFTVNGSTVASDTTAPFGFTWDTSTLANGDYVLAARASDSAGNAGMSAPVTVTVQNLQTVLTFSPVADTTVRNDLPSKNYGANPTLGADADPIKRAFMRFSVTGVGTGAIQSAKLRLYAVNASKVGGEIHRVASTSWDEMATTWQNAPAYDPAIAASVGPVALNQWYEVDIAALVQGDGSFSLAILSGSTDGAGYASREQADLAPVLVVTVRP